VSASSSLFHSSVVGSFVTALKTRRSRDAGKKLQRTKKKRQGQYHYKGGYFESHHYKHKSKEGGLERRVRQHGHVGGSRSAFVSASLDETKLVALGDTVIDIFSREGTGMTGANVVVDLPNLALGSSPSGEAARSFVESFLLESSRT